MTSKYDTEKNADNMVVPPPGRSASTSSEAAYDRLTGYAFAQRFVGGKTVVDIGWEGTAFGSRLLARTAESVVGLTGSAEATREASTTYSSQNVSYQSVDLTELPHSDDSFDVAVALGVVETLERPEDLVLELKRMLRKDGILVISASDKQTNANERNRRDPNSQREMYVSEFRELLERHFGHVRLYRQGAVAGGFVFPDSEEVAGPLVESAPFSLGDPVPITEPPKTRSVIAVCGEAEGTVQDERPYLLLDRDRLVFDECEDHAEDVELLRGEIRWMQETEVQAFIDALKLHRTAAFVLKRYMIHARNIGHTIRTESRMYRRLATPYRWLRARYRDSD
jgi:SAM-dependent methyltransferase